MLKTVAALLLAATALSACANHAGVPPAAHYDVAGKERQHIVGSARHWQVIAKDVAGRLAPHLNERERVVLLRNTADSVFSEVFAEMLETEFLERGHANTVMARRVPIVDFEATVVSHGRGVALAPGRFTLLGLGSGAAVWVANRAADLPVTAAAGVAVAGVAGLAAEAAMAGHPDAPNTEVVITATVTRDGLPTKRFTEVYYVADGSGWNYAPKASPATEKKVWLGAVPTR